MASDEEAPEGIAGVVLMRERDRRAPVGEAQLDTQNDPLEVVGVAREPASAPSFG